MTETKRSFRKSITRVLAATALLGMYVFSSTVMVTTTASPAMARGRGRGYRGGGRGRGNVGAAIGAGVAIGIIGGAIAADQARRSNSVNYCLSRFRSYDPASGTYLGNDGYRHPCP
jgi:hypothetical protein